MGHFWHPEDANKFYVYFSHTDYASRADEHRAFHERVAFVLFVIDRRLSPKSISLPYAPSTTPSEVDTTPYSVTGLDLLLGFYFTQTSDVSPPSYMR